MTPYETEFYIGQFFAHTRTSRLLIWEVTNVGKEELSIRSKRGVQTDIPVRVVRDFLHSGEWVELDDPL